VEGRDWFITAKRGGQRPELQVALFEYGKRAGVGGVRVTSGRCGVDGPIWIKVSEELFALRNNGGQRVLRASDPGGRREAQVEWTPG
jgi:hypothetical protein